MSPPLDELSPSSHLIGGRDVDGKRERQPSRGPRHRRSLTPLIAASAVPLVSSSRRAPSLPRGSRFRSETVRGGREMAAAGKLALCSLFAFAIYLSFAASVEDKCAACNAVAGEIELGLSNEKPRNHLDMRHRLDSKGQREGKVIDYRVSELRVIELLDGLCGKMQDYTLQKLDSGKQEWVKVEDWDDLRADKQEAKAHSKYISSFCGRLLEDAEDDLAEKFKSGSIKSGEVSKVLCEDISKYCRFKRDEEL